MTTIAFEDIATRLAGGASLTDDEVALLAGTYDIVSLGVLADDERRRRHDVSTTFVRVAEASAEALAGPVHVPPAARELRLSHLPAELTKAAATVRAGRSAAGDRTLTAGSLADIARAAGGDADLRRWLETLRGEGLDALDHLAIDRLDEPAGAVEAALAAGLPVARLLVGSASAEGPVATIRRVLALHAATGAVRAFAPLPRAQHPQPSTGYDDVKAVALARIMLRSVPHIQVDWSVHGPKLAQVALTFGADDVDNVSPLEEVAEGRRRAPLEEIRRNIRAAALAPVERGATFAVAR